MYKYRIIFGFAIICAIIIISKFYYKFYNKNLSYQAYLRYESSKLNVLLDINNDSIPNTKYNVIFFYSHNYKKLPDFFDKGYQILNAYCIKHRYKLLIFDHSNHTELLSTYWMRVKDLIILSQKYPESNNIFIYLDLDTCLNPMYLDIPIIDLINRIDYLNKKSWDMYVGNERIELINTGGLIVKNTIWSKRFLLLWWSKYFNSKWLYKEGKWMCYTKGNYCDWAQEGYEQGELINIYKNNEFDVKNHLIIINSSIISNDILEFNSFIYHFYGNGNRMPLYNKLYQNFTKLIY